MRYSPRSLPRRLASPLFLPAASSYHEVFTVAQLDKADAASAEADGTRPDEGLCRAAPPLSLLHLFPLPHPPITFCARTAPKPLGGAAGRNETPAAHSVPTRRAPAAWTKRRARQSRVHAISTGATVGAKAARGKGGGGGGWLSGLSAAALEVPPDVESGSADRGSQAAARASQRSETRARRRGGEGGGGEDDEEEDDEEGEAEGDKDRDAAPHGPRCMNPADPTTRRTCLTLTE
jgi:hypothetical protein